MIFVLLASHLHGLEIKAAPKWIPVVPHWLFQLRKGTFAQLIFEPQEESSSYACLKIWFLHQLLVWDVFRCPLAVQEHNPPTHLLSRSYVIRQKDGLCMTSSPKIHTTSRLGSFPTASINLFAFWLYFPRFYRLHSLEMLACSSG